MIKLIKLIVTFPFRSNAYEISRLGDPSGGWNIVKEGLTSDSVILAAGVGHNISFELDLIDEINATVHVFDPSPTGIRTIKNLAGSEQAEKIIFVTKALAGTSGAMHLEPPDDAEEGSWKQASAEPTLSALLIEAVSVSDYCRSLQIDHVDLLKIDIEGAEYDVIDDILRSGLSVKQICLEFHCKAQIGIKQTYFDLFWYACKLFFNGYRIVHLTKSDFSWIKHN